MKRKLILSIAALAVIAAAGSAVTSLSMSRASAQIAAGATTTEKTTTFAVENMTCALCPVTVKKAMSGVDGVRSVTVDFETKTATVMFDPSITSAEAVAAASAGAGYPAAPKG